MNRSIITLFSTRIIRLFCYGFLSVILALYLAQVGLPEQQIGLLFTLTLAGDAGISLWLTTSADRFGRKRTLIVGALLMLGAGIVFIVTHNIVLLLAAAIIGVISPSGNEIGPFLSVEQAGLDSARPERKAHADFRLVQPCRILRDRDWARCQAAGWLKRCNPAGCPRWTRIAPS